MRRTALLVRREIRDFVPVWALIVAGVVVVAALLRLALLQRWVELAVALVMTALAVLVVLLAVRRPADGRAEVDFALRTRSARVAVGLGLVTPASLAGEVTDLPGAALVVVSVVAFLAIVQRDRTGTTAPMR
ncbi:hypothetical protein GCM10027445_22860 [Amycolatopsis endophytica]